MPPLPAGIIVTLRQFQYSLRGMLQLASRPRTLPGPGRDCLQPRRQSASRGRNGGLGTAAGVQWSSETRHDLITARALEAQYGPDIAEIAELEDAIAVAESAVETGRDEVRLEAGVVDPRQFNELAAPIDAKHAAPLAAAPHRARQGSHPGR